MKTSHQVHFKGKIIEPVFIHDIALKFIICKVVALFPGLVKIDTMKYKLVTFVWWCFRCKTGEFECTSLCVVLLVYVCGSYSFKDRAHLSTFKIFIFEKCSCFILLVVFLVIVKSPELISVWFCEKMTFFPNFFSYPIFAIYVGGASLGLPTPCRLIAVSGARLPPSTVWS